MYRIKFEMKAFKIIFISGILLVLTSVIALLVMDEPLVKLYGAFGAAIIFISIFNISKIYKTYNYTIKDTDNWYHYDKLQLSKTILLVSNVGTDSHIYSDVVYYIGTFDGKVLVKLNAHIGTISINTVEVNLTTIIRAKKALMLRRSNKIISMYSDFKSKNK